MYAKAFVERCLMPLSCALINQSQGFVCFTHDETKKVPNYYGTGGRISEDFSFLLLSESR